MKQLVSIGFQVNTHFTAHLHHTWEVVYYVRGTVQLTVGDQIFVCEPGSLVFLPPGRAHQEDCQEGYANYFFTVGRFSLPICTTTILRDLADHPMQQILSQMLYLFHTRNLKWQPTIESLLDVLTQYVAGLMEQPVRQPLVGQFINILIDNIGNEQFRLQAAMADLPMSSDHFRILFTRETGRSPLHYLNDLRIQHACSLLRADLDNRHLAIQTVSRQCGFADPYYFSRAFRKKIGLSPQRWLIQERMQTALREDVIFANSSDACSVEAIGKER